MDDTLELSKEESNRIHDYNSLRFGFLKLDIPEEQQTKLFLNKVVTCMEKRIKLALQEPNDENRIEPKIYCILGHINLLLDNFPKALSAYQRYYSLEKENWKDSAFLYGLGITYFHFNSYSWATRAFQHLLYLYPDFKCSNEVHIRLGLITKSQADYETSYKHFNLALKDSSPCSLSKYELQFHIAHIMELQGKYNQAKEAYELLSNTPSILNILKANALRQLGWMYHTVDCLGDTSSREAMAVKYLKQSIDVDPSSGQSWYFLGRCLSSVGKVHEAFVSYRHSIDKSEASADTWCSIGVLYQQQNQHMDALQAYICAVQLDRSHSAAWTDLGILYESCNQPKDALVCYTNAASTSKTTPSLNISTRIKILQQHLSQIPPQYFQTRTKTLPSIEEAWSLPIPAELTSRQGGNNNNSQNRNNQQSKFPTSQVATQQTNQPNQIQLSQSHINQAQLGQSLSTQVQSDQQQANQGQSQFSDGQMIMTSSTQYSQINLNKLNVDKSTDKELCLDDVSHSLQLSGSNLDATDEAPNFKKARLSPFKTEQKDLPCLMTTQEIQNLQFLQQKKQCLSPQNIEILQKLEHKFSQHQQYLIQQLGTTSSESTISQSTDSSVAVASSDSQIDEAKTSINNIDDNNISMNCDLEINELISTNEEKVEPTTQLPIVEEVPKDENHVIKIKSEIIDCPQMDSLFWRGEELEVGMETTVEEADDGFSIAMTSAQIIAKTKELPKNSGLNCSLLCCNGPPPVPPKKPLIKEEIHPATPSIYLENKKDAFSIELQQYCLSQHVCVIRGLAGALKLDLGLFSTKTLVETSPDHQVEIRTQRLQAPDDNVDQAGMKVWRCESSRSFMPVSRYAQYQASSFQESLREESEKCKSGWKDKDSDTDSNSSAINRKKHTMIKFGTNVDLSDEEKWKPQLQELTKLPVFTRVVSASNLLSHVGHHILGVNTVQLYMKVPGCRTPGHQENNNFCGVNINIGPGDCEWFAVPYSYWGVMYELCEKNKLNYLKGSWWPNLDDLLEKNIPVYRFIQKPGDLVWLGLGTIHWVQAIGWCNNIAWNVGPPTWKQFHLSIESYEFNKLESYKSIVPLMLLAFNLAQNMKVQDLQLFELVKRILMKLLRQTIYITELVMELGIEMRYQARAEGEQAPYCICCECEVFNIVFVLNQDKKSLVHCINCARKYSPDLSNFIILYQFKTQHVAHVYDNFQLASMPQKNSDNWLSW